MKEFIVKGTPDSNREIIDYTRSGKYPASMEKNGDDVQQLTIGTDWLYPWDVLTIYDNGDYRVEKFTT